MRALSVRLLGAVFFLTAATTAQAANVGYYEMCDGQGDPAQITPITAAGQTPVDILDLSPGELAGIDLLFVNNCSNGAYSAEYLGALTDIENAVNAGLKLMIHDRYVTEGESILPGGGSFDIVRDFSDDADINILNNSTKLTDGAGGVIDDTTLDGGTSSSHGYAVEGTLPGSALLLFSRGNPSEIVSFAYGFGSGAVYYSSIPLDYYLAGQSPAAFSNIYAVNAIDYGTGTGAGYMSDLGSAATPAIPVPAMNIWGLMLLLTLVLALGLVAHRRVF